MTYAILDSIAYMFFQLLGNGMIMTLFFCVFVILLLAAAKVTNPTVYMSILFPMILGFILNSSTTNYIEVSSWIIFPVFMIGGIFFAIALIKIFTDN